jgi:hypothetical protein
MIGFSPHTPSIYSAALFASLSFDAEETQVEREQARRATK